MNPDLLQATRELSRKPKTTTAALGQRAESGRVIIVHPLGLRLEFNANHRNAAKLLEFAAGCIRDLENEYAIHDWSI